MVFFMPYLKKNKFLWGALLWLSFCLPVFAANAGIQIKSAELKQIDEVYYLDAKLNVTLSPILEEALKNGVSLYFITDFDFTHPRWYWWNEDFAHVSRVTRLSYNALLQQYLVSGINLRARSFDTLAEALFQLGEIDDWPVIARDRLVKHELYQATLSMRLDTSELPKPLQINAIATGRWELDSTPLVWMMTL